MEIIYCFSDKNIFIFFLIILELRLGWNYLLIFFSCVDHSTLLSASHHFSLFCLLLLLLILSLLQTDEVFTINLIQLLFDIVNNLCDPWNQYKLERIHTTICHL